MDLNGFGIQLSLPEGHTLKSIPLPPEVVAELKKHSGKHTEEYFREYINDEKLYNALKNDFYRLMHECVPDGLYCKFCTEKTGKEEDKACKIYILQMQVTYSLALNEFVNIVERNRHIIKEQKFFRRLAERFASCFYFIQNKGVVWFDLPELLKLTLSEGLLSISEQFAKAPTLSNLSAINDTLDDLSTKKITRELTGEKDYDMLPTQIEFFQAKQTYYEKKRSLDEEVHKRSKVFDRPHRIDMALFAYYVYQFEYKLNDNSFPSVKFWKALATEFNVHYKGIQQHYNTNRKTESRISSANVESIEFVANKMLEDYPKAKALAIDELKLAKLK